MPGVGVRVTGPGLLDAQATVTDDTGRFVIKGPFQPPPATYTVIAKLLGFETATVMVRASGEGVDGPFTIRLRIGCYEPDLEVIPDLDWLVSNADVIAVVRLDSIERGQHARIGDEWCGPITRLRATIVEPVRDHRSQQSRSISFELAGHDLPLAPEDTFIAILRWHATSRVYRVISRGYFKLVRAGQVRWPYAVRGSNKPLADVLSTLRSLSPP